MCPYVAGLGVHSRRNTLEAEPQWGKLSDDGRIWREEDSEEGIKGHP